MFYWCMASLKSYERCDTVYSMSAIEYVDILTPPHFRPSGEIKPVRQAVDDENWLGAINLWIVRPGPSLIYQERPAGGWAPGKLDGSVAGFYRAGESGLDGLREAREELGKDYPHIDVTSLGRRLNIGVDGKGRERHVVVDIYMVYDDQPLSSFKLDPVEVPAMYEIPVDELLAAFSDAHTTITVRGINSQGEPIERQVTSEDFTYMWDNYHPKIAAFAKRYAAGERKLEY